MAWLDKPLTGRGEYATGSTASEATAGLVINEGGDMSETPAPDTAPPDQDEQRLAELGYKQELERSWGGFTNFAISFSIISILAGTFTTYGQAWNNGGPVAVVWGWAILSIFILIIGLNMSEIVSAYPTAGGIYYIAAKMGGPVWGWFTGWFNLIGLVGVVASVDYFAAQFLSITISLFNSDWAGGNPFDLKWVFLLYLILLTIHVILNLFPSHILAYWNNTSAFWHIGGPVIVVLLLIFAVSDHQSASFVFTQTINNSGFFSGDSGGPGFWFYVVPLGFLLTQYTITGFDASAHMSEETHGASKAAAQGIWRSIFYSAVGGWLLLVAFTFAATKTDVINGVVTDQGNFYGVGSVVTIFATSMGLAAFKVIMIISTIGQIFCAGSGMTSASRMMYAFSRDRATPGWRLWSKVNTSHAPVNATLAIAVACVIVALPALLGNEGGIPYAFLALVAITVIGLYIAYVIPIYLRWRMGDSFVPGPWTLGKKYKWMAPIAVIEVIVVCIYFSAPFSPLGIPWNDGFALDNGAVQYAPVVVFGVILVVGLWWLVSARKWFTGPISNVEKPVESTSTESAPS